jgi:hypothetical protein
MRASSCTLAAVLLVVLNGSAWAIDIGTIDQSNPPAVKDLSAPQSDKDIARVGERANITGKVDKIDKRKVYLLVNPLGNPMTKDVWWVQEEVGRDGDAFEGSCQFGEGAVGVGEYFAVVGVVTTDSLEVGQMLRGVPAKLMYSKLKILKRTE